ncbi:hypothetical protein O181_008896 [Austropuccinia psidii MF-1]|uniref:Integrase catalytic domain-containing protein n=1 Tax=Austropuccinia psidii MF-1 TaxID=1389203 RepID=A0A9Q3GIY9_9BASI|nr:hypothetical protein [Austropuccinia psidii MF-1]
MGPLPISFDSKKFLLVIQDHFSRLVAVVPIAEKAKAKHKLHLWMVKLINCTGFKIKQLRMDNGAEFKNLFLNNFLNESGIIHETSIPYEHPQNGKSKEQTVLYPKLPKQCYLLLDCPGTYGHTLFDMLLGSLIIPYMPMM